MKQFKKCVNFDKKGQFFSEALLEEALGIFGFRKGNRKRNTYTIYYYTPDHMDLKTFGGADFAKNRPSFRSIL